MAEQLRKHIALLLSQRTWLWFSAPHSLWLTIAYNSYFQGKLLPLPASTGIYTHLNLHRSAYVHEYKCLKKLKNHDIYLFVHVWGCACADVRRQPAGTDSLSTCGIQESVGLSRPPSADLSLWSTMISCFWIDHSWK